MSAITKKDFTLYITATGKVINAKRIHHRHDTTKHRLIDDDGVDISHMDAYPIPKVLIKPAEMALIHWSVIYCLAKMEYNITVNILQN